MQKILQAHFAGHSFMKRVFSLSLLFDKHYSEDFLEKFVKDVTEKVIQMWYTHTGLWLGESEVAELVDAIWEVTVRANKH